MACGESLDHGAREELQMLQAGDVFGVKDVGERGHGRK